MVERDSQAAADADAEQADSIDPERIREIVGFVLRAPRRRPKLALGTFLVVAGLGVTAGITMPRLYTSEVKLLAQRSAIHALTGQTTQVEDNPTKNVAAMIMRRDNLVALAKEADLPARFYATRPAALRLKDRVTAALFGPMSENDKLQAMVNTLATKLQVTITEDSIVDITVDWSNPGLSYDLVTLVQKNFLEARYDSDVAVINDSIAVLEEHVKTELARVDTELDKYQNILNTRAPQPVASSTARDVVALTAPTFAGRGLVPAAPATAGAAAPILDPDLTRQLEEKRAQIRGLEESRQRTVDSLNQQLGQAQLTLTPMHPTVIALQQQIAAMSEPPPELAQLRSDVRTLMAQIASANVVVPPLPPPPTRTLAQVLHPPGTADAEAPQPEPLPRTALATLDRDGPLQLAQSQLALAIRAYEDALMRLDAAKVELDITGAAYKHRYTVVTPAEFPKSPKKQTGRIVAVASVLGGALIALLLAAALDVLSGVVLETWHVLRRLKLDVLGELDNPS